jgi:H+-translocating NAD(P) transhydrogenase subunit beta
MSVNLAAFLYLVSGVLFILALRGLSHPTTSRQGNMYGMIGMAISIVTTLLLARPSFGGLVLIVIGIAIGGGIGAVIARRIAMTAMPQLWWPRPQFTRRIPSVSAKWARSTVRR